MPKIFSRTFEDFICKYCGLAVKGNGYTNHCPHCLYSLHVDINPGDRAAHCGGLMAPLRLELKNKKYIVVQKCLTCGFERKNKVTDDDNFEAVLALTSNY